jgi:hypothetical protein
MRMASSAAMPDRENGTGHPLASLAAGAGKLPGSSASQTRHGLAVTRGLLIGIIALLGTTVFGPSTYAQSGPFAGMAGVWAGRGVVTLEDGSTERIRCRATDAVGDGGNGLNLTLLCASDSYRFDLTGNVISEGGELSGTWGESSRGLRGNLRGRGANGNFQVIASAPGFTADLSLSTRGNRQSIVIRSRSGFRDASISLSRR